MSQPTTTPPVASPTSALAEPGRVLEQIERLDDRIGELRRYL
jgi:hypothetical protein